MSLSSEEAQASLNQVADAERRSSQLYFYHCSSPHLIMWGIIWIIGYGGTGLFPHYANLLWLGLIVIGCIGGMVIGQRHKDGHLLSAPKTWRFGALWAIILFFVLSTYAILHPTDGRQFCAFPALITGCVYMAIGLWRGLRYVISGAVVTALTLFGFFYIDQFFATALWFAVVGGSAMILTGLWFRTV
jgi:hypothetical protein